MGNECSVIEGGDTETTLTSTSGTIISATNYDDDEECKWNIRPKVQNDDVMIFNVTSPNLSCDKASFKIAGREYCQRSRPFCMIYSKDNCGGRLEIDGCDRQTLAEYPSVEFRGKDDANDKGFELSYRVENCDEVVHTTPVSTTTQEATTAETTTNYVEEATLVTNRTENTTHFTSNRNLSTFESELQTTSNHNSLQGVPLHFTTILIPVLVLVMLILLATWLVIRIRRQRRVQQKQIVSTISQFPAHNNSNDTYEMAENIATTDLNGLQFENSYEAIPRGDIVPVYTVIRENTTSSEIAGNYETLDNVRKIPLPSEGMTTGKSDSQPREISSDGEYSTLDIIEIRNNSTMSENITKTDLEPGCNDEYNSLDRVGIRKNPITSEIKSSVDSCQYESVEIPSTEKNAIRSNITMSDSNSPARIKSGGIVPVYSVVRKKPKIPEYASVLTESAKNSNYDVADNTAQSNVGTDSFIQSYEAVTPISKPEQSDTKEFHDKLFTEYNNETFTMENEYSTTSKSTEDISESNDVYNTLTRK